MLWRETKDGIIFTVPHKNLGDVHLLIMEKEGRFSWHIKDGRETKKEKKYPIAGHFRSEDIAKRSMEIIKKYVRNFHGNKTAWVMTSKLKNKVKSELKKKGFAESTFPLEIIKMAVECDFINKKRWKRIRIKDMLLYREGVGFIKEKNVIRLVLPSASRPNEALFMSHRQLILIQSKLQKITGVDEYLEYIAPEIKEDLEKKVKCIIKKNK